MPKQLQDEFEALPALFNKRIPQNLAYITGFALLLFGSDKIITK